MQTLLERQVEGLVVAPSSVTHCDHLANARAEGVPVVLLDRHQPQLDCDSVVVDNEAAARNAVTHLLSLGHRRIGLLASINASEQPEIVPPGGSRRAGVVLAAGHAWPAARFTPPARCVTGWPKQSREARTPTAMAGRIRGEEGQDGTGHGEVVQRR